MTPLRKVFTQGTAYLCPTIFRRLLRQRTVWTAAITLMLIMAAGLSLRLDLLNETSRLPNQTQAADANSSSSTAPANQETRARVAESFDKLPLNFIENRGQMDERVAYYVQGHDKTVYFTDQGLTFALNKRPEPGTEARNEARLQPASFNPQLNNPQAQPSASERYVLKLDFVGARAGVHPEGRGQDGATFSYFRGPRSQWNAGVKSYSQIVYRDLWPGIDLVYAGTVNRMKYSFVVKPGADTNQIKLAWRGASDVKLNAAGELEVKTPMGGFNDDRPISWQEADGRQIDVKTAYRIESDQENQSAIRNPQSHTVSRLENMTVAAS